jgi:hypothetical protein
MPFEGVDKNLEEKVWEKGERISPFLSKKRRKIVLSPFLILSISAY